MSGLVQDIRFSLRTLVRNPGFAVVALVTLALGIGANTTIFSIVSGVLLRPLPYKDPERIVLLWGNHNVIGREVASQPDFVDWRARSTDVFERVAAVHTVGYNLSGEGEPVPVSGARATADYMPVFGVAPLHGRWFVPEEEKPDAPKVVVLGYTLWQSRYAADAAIVGRTVRLDGVEHTVVGIAPPQFRTPTRTTELWVPLPENSGAPRRADFLTVYARLKPGVSVDKAQARMTAVAANLRQEYPDTNAGWEIDVASLQEEVVKDVRPALLVFSGAVGCVLLIACVNVANLMLARGTARRREVAVRAALGAATGRLVRQILTESIILSLLGGAIGILLAMWGVELVRTLGPRSIPRIDQVRVDGPVLVFTAALSALTGVLFGLAPALGMSRTDMHSSLKDGARSSDSGGFGRIGVRGTLVVAEVALALVLLVAAGLMTRAFERLRGIDPGFEPRNVLTMQIRLPAVKYPEAAQRIAFASDLLERIRALPGVGRAGATSGLPMLGGSYLTFSIEGRPEPPAEVVRDANVYAVGPGYLEALGVSVLEGRGLEERDIVPAPPAPPASATADPAAPAPAAPVPCLISRKLADRYWPGESPLGRRVTLSGPNGWMTIVGVVGDVRTQSLDQLPYPQMYAPLSRFTGTHITIAVRTARDPAGMIAAVRSQVAAIDPEQPVANIRTLEDVVGETLAEPRFARLVLGVFGAVSLALASVGVYGVMAYSVGRRTQEIGVRMALGALPADILVLVIRQGLVLVLLGVACGLAGAWALTRFMSGLLYGVGAQDPATFLATAAVLTLAALVASYIPARRATRVQPIVALRAE